MHLTDRIKENTKENIMRGNGNSKKKNKEEEMTNKSLKYTKKYIINF